MLFTIRGVTRSIATSVLAVLALGPIALPATPAAASTPVRTYHIRVATGTVNNASTDANVFITLFGSLGSSGERVLNNPDHDDFQAGNTDHFFIKAPNLGDLTGVRIRHDNTGSGPGWWLRQIQIDDDCTGDFYVFPAQRWLALNEGDHKIDLNLAMTMHGTVSPTYHYALTTVTGVQENAGTDARVYAMIQGQYSGSGEQQLDTPGVNDFERGRMDDFDLTTGAWLGNIQSVRIRHDNSGSAPGWYLQALRVTNECLGTDYTFRAGTWLALSEAPNRIDVVFTP
jgi:lipoxygenase homology domain-containing protein 1